MRNGRFSDTQIMGVLKQAESGAPDTEFCHEHGMSSTSFYKSLANPLPTLAKNAAIPRHKDRDRFFISTHPRTDIPRWYPIQTDL